MSVDPARGQTTPSVPDRAVTIVFFLEAVRVTGLWLFVYGGLSWITGLHSHRLRIWTDAEMAMPFVPAAAVVYLSLFPMLWMAPLVLPDVARVRRFAAALIWVIMISAVGFVLFPAVPAYPTMPVAELWRPIFEFADAANLQYNMLPSLHVGMAVVCATHYSRRAKRPVQFIFWTWAIAIAVSTLLTHQHHIADVLAGAACGTLVCWRLNREKTRIFNMNGDVVKGRDL